MAKLCVITRRALADGFRLAGVEVHEADSAELARGELASLLKDEDVGMVALDADYYEALDARTRARLEGRLRPIVVPLPIPSGRAPAEQRSRYVADLIQRAIGLKITVRR